MIRNLFCMFVAAAWTTVLFPLCVVLMVAKWDAGAALWVVRRLWSPVLLWAGGAKLSVTGAEQVPTDRPCIYVSNHQSTIDIPTLFIALPVEFRFVAKHSLKYVPVLGWYMSLAKFVFIDRSNHKRALKSLEAAAAQVRGGSSIVMFPEGTRSETRAILPFKKGPFALAMAAKVPLVPVAIEGSGQLMPKDSWNITPGPIRVAIGAPIDVTPFGDDREAAMRVVRDAIIDLNAALGGKGGDKSQAIAPRGPRSEEPT